MQNIIDRIICMFITVNPIFYVLVALIVFVLIPALVYLLKQRARIAEEEGRDFWTLRLLTDDFEE